ncbi:NAD-dependent epimerase/dehydratase family protein [Streptomyces marianii]|uniref:NAD-dependent epimerase/dehydratase family protein n=1 Tax=Streptomyces marianii TaxID=1817406 RepID=UPI001F3530E3|nr:NAD-dependent epimerase/dehydratase family protein [Streptomyces marianii]
MNQALRGEPFTVFGDGEQTRAFGYIKDVVPSIARHVEVPEAYNEVFNAGGPRVYSVNGIAAAVCDALGVALRVSHLPERDGVRDACATRLREAAADVLRHSRALDCRVAVATPPGEVLPTAANDGVGAPARPIPPAPGPGLRPRSLAERIAAAGGRLTRGPYPSGHHTLEARFPRAAPSSDGSRAA